MATNIISARSSDTRINKRNYSHHGYTKGYTKKPEYYIWQSMKSRCCNENNKDFHLYGGRGITVCNRWLYGDQNLSAFQCFIRDMGDRRSKKLSLDRIDNDGNYKPDNCRWATTRQQRLNQRPKSYSSAGRWLNFNGHHMMLTDAVSLLKDAIDKGDHVEYMIEIG